MWHVSEMSHRTCIMGDTPPPFSAAVLCAAIATYALGLMPGQVPCQTQCLSCPPTQATQPGSGGAAAAAAAASSADPPSFLLLPPEEAAALESSTSRVSPLTQVGIPSHGSNVHARSTQGLQSLTIQEPSRAIDSSLVQQQAQQLHIRGGSGVGSAANEGTGLLGDSVGYASRGELKGMEIEVGKSSGAGQGSAGTLINSGIQEGTVPWGRSSSSSSNSSNSSSRGSSKSSSARTVATPKLYQPLKHAQKLARRALLLLQPLILEAHAALLKHIKKAHAALFKHILGMRCTVKGYLRAHAALLKHTKQARAALLKRGGFTVGSKLLKLLLVLAIGMLNRAAPGQLASAAQITTS
eukprot:1158027-Pelagomonas_calceolata.AAC.7